MPTQPIEQVGGTHYAGSYQHWDYCDDLDVPCLEYGASKYVARWYKKNGVLDLKKAISFIDKRLSTNYDRTHDSLAIQAEGKEDHLVMYFDACGILPWERAVSRLILCWTDYSDLEYAKTLILAQIKHEETKQGTKHE